ncbi:MAG: hypothetical protein AB9834_22125 [Lentimicrobium sp.]
MQRYHFSSCETIRVYEGVYHPENGGNSLFDVLEKEKQQSPVID